MTRNTKIFVTMALQAKIDELMKERIPGAYRLSKASDLSAEAQDYFKRHADELKQSVADMRELIHEVSERA